MDDHEFITSTQCGEMLGITRMAWDNGVLAGKYPKHIRMGKRRAGDATRLVRLWWIHDVRPFAPKMAHEALAPLNALVKGRPAGHFFGG